MVTGDSFCALLRFRVLTMERRQVATAAIGDLFEGGLVHSA